jgi:predicted Zn-dependent peptidase
MIYKGSSYEHPVDDIKYHSHNTLNHTLMLKIYNSFYRPDNMILSVVSNIPFKQIIQIIKKTYFLYNKKTIFPKLEKHVIFNLTPQIEKPNCIIHKKMGVNASNIVLSFRTCSQYEKDKYVLELLKEIIGGNGNSMLFNILREKNGLTYTSNVTTNYYENTGHFAINAITDSSKILFNGNKKGVLKIIIELLNNIIIHGINQSSLHNSKQKIKGKFNMNLENNETSSLHNAEYLLLYPNNKYISYENMYDIYYDSIDLKDINRVIVKYFNISNMNICILTDEHTAIKSETIKKECEKLVAR